jgi:hypothetical protein
VNPLQEILKQHKGKGAGVNNKESQWFGWLVIDLDPYKTEKDSVSTIEDVSESLLILNYYDSKEMHFIPLEKIIKVNVKVRRPAT